MGSNHDGIRQIARRDAVWYSRRSENQKKCTDQQDQSRWASNEVGTGGTCQREI